MSPKVPNYLREVSLRFASPPETSSSSLPALVEPHPRRTPHRGGTLLRRPAARRLLVPLVHHAVPLAAVAPGDDRARVHPPKQRAPLPAAGIAAPYPLQRRRRVVRRADGRRHPPADGGRRGRAPLPAHAGLARPCHARLVRLVAVQPSYPDAEVASDALVGGTLGSGRAGGVVVLLGRGALRPLGVVAVHAAVPLRGELASVDDAAESSPLLTPVALDPSRILRPLRRAEDARLLLLARPFVSVEINLPLLRLSVRSARPGVLRRLHRGGRVRPPRRVALLLRPLLGGHRRADRAPLLPPPPVLLGRQRAHRPPRPLARGRRPRPTLGVVVRVHPEGRGVEPLQAPLAVHPEVLLRGRLEHVPVDGAAPPRARVVGVLLVVVGRVGLDDRAERGVLVLLEGPAHHVVDRGLLRRVGRDGGSGGGGARGGLALAGSGRGLFGTGLALGRRLRLLLLAPLRLLLGVGGSRALLRRGLLRRGFRGDLLGGLLGAPGGGLGRRLRLGDDPGLDGLLPRRGGQRRGGDLADADADHRRGRLGRGRDGRGPLAPARQDRRQGLHHGGGGPRGGARRGAGRGLLRQGRRGARSRAGLHDGAPGSLRRWPGVLRRRPRGGRRHRALLPAAGRGRRGRRRRLAACRDGADARPGRGDVRVDVFGGRGRGTGRRARDGRRLPRRLRLLFLRLTRGRRSRGPGCSSLLAVHPFTSCGCRQHN
mmetsp:Transcript_11574/g.26375  ORF Transcript_11574/g.26375 Transcript_11574/m.26375 type:complete len:712 (+) Transcript_11574:155-2290(+)